MIAGKILPLHVLVKEEAVAEKSEGGIIIPTNIVKKDNKIGVVVLAGNSTINEEMNIKVGDKVLFSPQAFRKFTHPEDGQEYLLVKQGDVMLHAF